MDTFFINKMINKYHFKVRELKNIFIQGIYDNFFHVYFKNMYLENFMEC